MFVCLVDRKYEKSNDINGASSSANGSHKIMHAN